MVTVQPKDIFSKMTKSQIACEGLGMLFLLPASQSYTLAMHYTTTQLLWLNGYTPGPGQASSSHISHPAKMMLFSLRHPAVQMAVPLQAHQQSKEAGNTFIFSP